MAELSQYNIHSICRICLEYLDSENIYDLFVIPGLAKKLQLCTSLTVESQDGFPKNLCGVCYTRLNELHDFQKQCVDSVQKLQEMVASNTIAYSQGPTFDMLETGTGVIGENANIDEDDRLNFDPLLNHKMELIDNEEDVFKMLEHVENDMKCEIPLMDDKDEKNYKDNKNDKKCEENDYENDDASRDAEVFSAPSTESEDNDDDEDFVPDAKSENSNDSDDDLPLVLRLRKSKEGDSFKAKAGPKPKRKRIPVKERHLHTLIDCHLCHKKFKKVIRYQEHMKSHNDRLPHQCTVPNCLKGFATASGLRLHVEHTHSELTTGMPCPEEGCDQVFPGKRLLNWHLKKVHNIVKDVNEPKSYSCTECEKVFRCQMALKKHMYKHDGKELPFPCNICGKRFVINSALRDHLMRHAGIKNYVCPYCGVGKTTKQEWNTHINTHTQEKKFQCQLCPHASFNKQNLRMHVKIVHEKIKNYACQYCGKTFGKSNACKMHETTHTGEKPCECKVCGKRFLYPNALTKHLKTHETRVLRAIEVYSKRKSEIGKNGENPESSSLPELTETENNSKEAHAKVAEEILKVCAESVACIPKNPRRVERVDISQLAGTAVHPITSVAVPSWSPQVNFMMKEGPYICSECGQSFNIEGNLRKHRRIIHEGVKDYACRFCHKRFAKSQTLKNHEMIHTGEKPHECDFCGKRFNLIGALKRHYKVHTNKPASTISSAVYEAREELQAQENKKLEDKRKAEEERAVIAVAAKEQLEIMKLQQEELQRLQKGLGKDSGNNYHPSSTARPAVAANTAAASEFLDNSTLREFPTPNINTMETPTTGVSDA